MAEQEKAKPRKKQEIDYPLVLLCVLLTVVGVLIFIGYDYLRDDTPTSAPLAIAEASSESSEEKSSAETVAEAKSEATTPKAAAKSKAVKKPTEEKEKSASAASTPKKTEKKVNAKAIPAGGRTITHTVKSAETFSSIARRYNLSRQALEALNPEIDAEKGLKSGVTQLKVKVKAMHTVGPGDVLSKVAAKYGVSKTQLMTANGKTKDFAKRGETLVIPFP